MAKILLVEDDKSLREIYGVRLMAEGYDIVSAGDGEEALAMAIKERPDLIVSDVMMPKISGFDMLDILRSTSETKDVKVIMMTALSSDDQRARGESLGADRYLVKSQVGIEDVVRTVHDVLGDSSLGAAAPAPVAADPATPAADPLASVPAAPATPVAPAPAPDPVAAAPVVDPAVFAATPAPAAAPAPAPVAPAPEFVAPTPAPAPAPIAPEPVAAPAPAPVIPEPAPAPVVDPASAYAPAAPAPVPIPEPIAPVPVTIPAPAPAAPAPIAPEPVAAPAPVPPQSATLSELPAAPAPLPQPTAPFSSPAPASLGERVIEPLTTPVDTATVDIASQMAQALNDPSAPAGTGVPPVPPAQ